jgi:hypothetical protein
MSRPNSQSMSTRPEATSATCQEVGPRLRTTPIFGSVGSLSQPSVTDLRRPWRSYVDEATIRPWRKARLEAGPKAKRPFGP